LAQCMPAGLTDYERGGKVEEAVREVVERGAVHACGTYSLREGAKERRR
jgi:hypothetical protein